jgi:hypothetical protein
VENATNDQKKKIPYGGKIYQMVSNIPKSSTQDPPKFI